RLLDLSVTATNGVAGHFQNDIELVQGPNNATYVSTRVDRLLVAVTEAAPFRVRLREPKAPLVQGGSMDLKVEADRDAGFDETINVKMLWTPPGVSSLPDITIAKGETNAVYVLNSKSDAELREWNITVLASAKVHGGELFVSSPLTRLELAAPYLTAKIET